MSTNHILMFTGYFLMGVALLLALTLCFCRNAKGNNNNNKEKQPKKDEPKSGDSSALTKPKSAETPIITATSSQQQSVVVGGLRLEELLKAPAELLGRGRHGSVYKVTVGENPRMFLTVKRIKDWDIGEDDFRRRMQRLSELENHRSVMRALAFYSSAFEKLLVYEYQHNGTLLGLLQGIQMGKTFDWSSRPSVAAITADALAFMHNELKEDRIPHGNLKSSNIMFNNNMEPCITEYGLIPADNNNNNNNEKEEEEEEGFFKADIYGFGVILLELLTGKLMVQDNNGQDLASWVLSVLREEWTVEVFDKALIREGANEGRIVGLLQVAVKCVNRSPEDRPSMNEVASMICSIRDEEERSMDDVSLSITT